jgi:hypothetical protein
MARDLFEEAGITPSMEGGGRDLFAEAGIVPGGRDLFAEAGIEMEPVRVSEGRGALDWARDLGVAALKGAVGLPQAVVGLADIPTGGRVGKALEDAGFRPGEAQKMLDEFYSSQQQAANRAVQEADGFIPTLSAAIDNPSAIGATAIESLPQMLGGAGAVRGVMKVAPKVAPWLAGALGEGVMGAGSAASQIRGETADGLLTTDQSLAALGSGAGTALLGAAGGKIAHRLGVGDIDTMLAGGAKLSKAPAGFVKQVLGAGISEGVFEELPQSIQEQMWQNYALGKPLTQGVGNAAAVGMLTGAAMGAAGGGFNAAMRGPAQEPASVGAANPFDAIPVDEVLGAVEPSVDQGAANPDARAAELELLAQQRPLTEAESAELARLSAEPEPDPLTAAPDVPQQDLPPLQLVPGAPTTFSTETGSHLDAQYALAEADELQTSHDRDLRPNPIYPAELQPRQRERHASELQIQDIVARLDPARLGVSADAATGAPIVGPDGLVESGNARTISLKRVYQANGQNADAYRAFLRENAAQFGLAPEQVDVMRQPVLVRVRSTPVNRAEFARQANASTVAQMSPSEQAHADAARIDELEDLRPDEHGDFSTSREFIRRFVGRLPGTERGGMLDAAGQLSSAGYARVRNAVLAKAYGDSPILARMVESMDDNQRTISRALMIAAPRVAQARSAIGEGRLHDADITPHLVGAAEAMARLKQRGTSVDDALAQAGLLGDEFSPETRDLMQFLARNARRPRRMAEFITAYFDALEAAGDPAQGSLLGETAAPTTTDLLGAARRTTEGVPTDEGSHAANPERRDDRGAAPVRDEAAGKPANAPRAGSGTQEDGAAGTLAASQGEGAEWRAFPAESGTLGIPRAKMPQIKASVRPQLLAFLDARGITNRQEQVAADDLKPAQAEYAPAKVAAARDQGGDAGVLVSSDGYVLDGHHRWLAKAAVEEPISVRRFSAPIDQLLDAVREFAGTTATNESPVLREERAAAVERFYAAAADLVKVTAKYKDAVMIPESTPGFRDVLVRLFEPAMQIAGIDITPAMAWVRERLRLNPGTSVRWSRISARSYRLAAEAAAKGEVPAAETTDRAHGEARPTTREAPAPQADRFPPVASITDAHAGPGGRIEPRPIAPGRPLYRETNPEGLDDLLRLDGQADIRAIFVADSRDLALGQGDNRGVLVTFRPDALSGREHAKPGTGDAAGREYRTDFLAPRAVQAVELSSADVTRLRLLTRRRLAEDFDRAPVADGRVRFVRKGLAMSPAAAPQVAEPLAEYVATAERDVYAVTEPGSTADVPLDLFPETLGDLQPVQGRAGGGDHREHAGRTEARDIRSTAAVSGEVEPNTLAVRQDPAFPGTYHYSTQLVEVGRRELPVAKVATWQQAASALQSLRRYAVEHFDVLVTDKAGKPLAVIGSFKGTQSRADVYPSTILAEALRVKGAARLWASHNHPSGQERLSRADERLNEALARTFEPTSLQWMGLSAVGHDRFEAVDADGEKRSGPLLDGSTPVSVPIAERTIAPANLGMPALDSPAAAQRVLAEASQHQSGLVFVDAEIRLTAWVPMDAETMLELRRDGRFDRLVNSASEAGAVAAFVANPGGGFDGRALRNITNALSRADIRVLDAIDTRSGESAAERGLLPGAGGTVFSRATLRVPQPRVAQGHDDSGAPFWATPDIKIGFPVDTDNLAVQPEPGERVLNYAVMPAGSFGVRGFVELLVRDGRPVALLDIEIGPEHRNGGTARKVVEALLSANRGRPIEISNIVESSRGFWARMGVPEQNRAAGEAYDASLTWADYARAQVGLQPHDEARGGARPGRTNFSRTAPGAGEGARAAALKGGGRIGVGPLQAVADGVRAALPGLPKVHVLASPAELGTDGAQRRLKTLIDQRDAADDVEGALHEGEIYLFASGIRGHERAEHVLAEHEAAHAGLRGVLGINLKQAMQSIYNQNAKVAKSARELVATGMSVAEAVEEVIVDMPSSELVKLKGWRLLVERVRDALARRGFNRVAAQLDRWLQGSLSEQARADLHVADLVRQARAFVARKGGSDAAPEPGPGPKLQRSVGFDGASATLVADFRNDLPMKRHADYKAAKGGDTAAALRLVQDLVKPSSLEAARAQFGPDVVYLPVHAEEASGRNKIPMAMANVYAARAGGSVTTNIVQANRAFHTGADAMQRLIARAEFNGHIEPGRRYVLVDDVTTMGSTLADLAAYVRAQGGEVVGSVVMVNAMRDAKMLPDAKLVRDLEARHGDEIRKLFGVHPGALTANEAQYLIGFRSADELRNRVTAAGRARSERLAAKAARSEEDDGLTRLSRAPANEPGGGPENQGPWARLKTRLAALTDPEVQDKLIYEFQDRFIDLKRIEAQIKAAGGVITDLNDAYMGESLYHRRLATRTQDFLKDELKPLLADLNARGITIEAFERFLHARHAPEANKVLADRNPNAQQIEAMRRAARKQVDELATKLESARRHGAATKAIEEALTQARAEAAKLAMAQAFKGAEAERLSLSGMSDAEAQAVMNALTAEQMAGMRVLAARVDAINDKTLKLLASYGLMSQDTLDTWRATYEHYVPLHRDEAHVDGRSHPIGQGFNVKGDAAKRRVGSNEKVTHILGHLAMQREAALTRGEKNQVTKQLYLLASQNPDPELWSVEKLPQVKTVDPATGLVRTGVDPMYRTKPNVVMLRIAGRDAAITFNEHNPQALRLAEAIQNLDQGDLHVVLGLAAKGTRWFASINTQWNPVFGLVNFARDLQAGLLNLSTTPIAGKEAAVAANVLKAMRAIYRAERGKTATDKEWSALWRDLQETGGTTGYRDLFADAEARAKAMQKEIEALNRGEVSKAAHAVLDWLSDFNETAENAVRLAAYRVALDAGMSKPQAATLSKNLTVNFNRKGRQAREIGALYAFFNASLQGTARMFETLRGPLGRKIMFGGVALGALNTLLGMAVMGGGADGDDEWDKIPGFVKERSLVIPLGRKDFLTIPMPLGFHIFPNIGRVAVEMAFGNDTKSKGRQLGELLMTLSDAFNPLGGSQNLAQMVAPTVIDPIAALMQNRDWTGRPIYREDRSALDPKPGHTLAKDSASSIGLGLTKALNAVTGGTEYTPGAWSPTPDQIDYVFGQLTGGVGRELLKLNQALKAPFTGDELPAHKVPVLGRFYGNTGGPSGQSERFYENLKAINEVEAELKGRQRNDGDVDGLRAWEPLLALTRRADDAERRVRDLRKQRREIVEKAEPGHKARLLAIDWDIAEAMRELNAAVVKARREPAAVD